MKGGQFISAIHSRGFTSVLLVQDRPKKISSAFVMNISQLLYIRLRMVCDVLLPEKQQSVSLATAVWFVRYIIACSSAVHSILPVWSELASYLCTALCFATRAISRLLQKFSCSVNWCMALRVGRYAKGYQQRFFLQHFCFLYNVKPCIYKAELKHKPSPLRPQNNSIYLLIWD